MKHQHLKARSKNIHKSRVTTARKPASLCATDSLIRELVQLNAKNCRGKLPADGKERLKVLQDRYSSIQAHRKRNGVELMPEVEDLFVEQMIREPAEAYPFEFSDDEPLPTLDGLSEGIEELEGIELQSTLCSEGSVDSAPLCEEEQELAEFYAAIEQ